MVNIKTQKSESPYVYKCAIECFGRSVEFGVSHEEVTKVRKAAEKFLFDIKNIKTNVHQAKKKWLDRKSVESPVAPRILRRAPKEDNSTKVVQ